MASQLVESVGSNRISAAGGASLIAAALMAFRFVARGGEGGSVLGMSIWLPMGLGFLIAGSLMIWRVVR